MTEPLGETPEKLAEVLLLFCQVTEGGKRKRIGSEGGVANPRLRNGRYWQVNIPGQFGSGLDIFLLIKFYYHSNCSSQIFNI